MENASKALIIAGAVLLAILTISLLVVLSNNLHIMGEAQETKVLAEQLQAFNQQYEVYNKKLMYGVEVITVMNKAEDNNIKNSTKQIRCRI